MENPYGAVPEALDKSRITLRDIMTDMLMSKKMENELSLARAKADTDTALVNADIEKNKLTNLRDMAALDENKRHAMTMEGQGQQQIDFTQGPQFNETKRVNTAHIKSLNASAALSGAHAGLFGEQLKALRQENELQNKTMTSQEYAAFNGFPGAQRLFGMKGNETMTYRQWESGFGQRLREMTKTYPSIQLDMSATAMQDALDSTIKQYHQTPATDTAGRKVLESKITDQYSTLEMMNKIMTNGKTNPAEIAKIGMAAWNTDAMAQTKYNGDMEAYLKDFANSVKQTQATYSDDLNKRKFYIKTGMTLDDAQNQCQRRSKNVFYLAV